VYTDEFDLVILISWCESTTFFIASSRYLSMGNIWGYDIGTEKA
jgi:hypothetical protein